MVLEREVGRHLAAAGLTIATAETCTGGLVSYRLISVPGSSAYVRGSVVAYANDVKTGLLGVDSAVIDTHGVVSEASALGLAQAARQALGADVGLATTGIAGPADPSRRSRKPVGLVFVAVAWPAGQLVEQHQWPTGDRTSNMAASAEAVLALALRVLQQLRQQP
jgi:PncC family amidohydrolase